MMLSDDKDSSSSSGEDEWIDPVVEIEDEQHSHTDLLAHVCKPTTCLSIITISIVTVM